MGRLLIFCIFAYLGAARGTRSRRVSKRAMNLTEIAKMDPTVAFEPNRWCNPNHHTWFDKSKRKRTCQE